MEICLRQFKEKHNSVIVKDINENYCINLIKSIKHFNFQKQSKIFYEVLPN